MRIEVTQADIVAGQARQCYRCPVALAVARALGVSVDSESVGVHLTWLMVDEVLQQVMGVTYWLPDNRPLFDVPLPKEVAQSITRFDAGWPMEPFAFDMEWPEEV